MDEKQQQAPRKKNRFLEWSVSGLIGVFSGFYGISTKTRLAFREKILDSIEKTDVIALTKDKNEMLELLAALETSLPGTAKQALHDKIALLEKHIADKKHLKDPYKEHNYAFNGQVHKVANLDLEMLEKEKTAKEQLIARIDTNPETLVSELSHEIKAIEARLRIKELHTQHGESLDKNFISRIIDSFNPSVEKQVATKSFLNNGRGLKRDFATELDKFVEEHIGINMKNPIKSTIQEAKFIGKHSKMEFATDVLIATTIGIAGPIMFFNSQHVRYKLNQILNHQGKMLDEAADKNR